MSKDTFTSERAAVRAAFNAEAYQICETSPFFRDLRGGTVPLPDDFVMTPWDRAAQGAMILSFLVRTLSPFDFAFLSARYTIAVTQPLERRKRAHVALVFERVRLELPKPPFHFAADVMRGWAGMRRHHRSMEWWAEHLSVDAQVIKRWLYGRRERNQRGILSLLDTLEQEIYDDRLREPMVKTKLIVPTPDDDKYGKRLGK